jgi:hypothetical protein
MYLAEGERKVPYFQLNQSSTSRALTSSLCHILPAKTLIFVSKLVRFITVNDEVAKLSNWLALWEIIPFLCWNTLPSQNDCWFIGLLNIVQNYRENVYENGSSIIFLEATNRNFSVCCGMEQGRPDQSYPCHFRSQFLVTCLLNNTKSEWLQRLDIYWDSSNNVKATGEQNKRNKKWSKW